MSKRRPQDPYRAITFWEEAGPDQLVEHCLWMDGHQIIHRDAARATEPMWTWKTRWGHYIDSQPSLIAKYRAAREALRTDSFWHMTPDSYSWVGPQEGEN